MRMRMRNEMNPRLGYLCIVVRLSLLDFSFWWWLLLFDVSFRLEAFGRARPGRREGTIIFS